jgi:hypothetical protein
MTGLGYFNPDWAHGLNKGPLAVGYDEIRTADIRTHLPPYSLPLYSLRLSEPNSDRACRRQNLRPAPVPPDAARHIPGLRQ